MHTHGARPRAQTRTYQHSRHHHHIRSCFGTSKRDSPARPRHGSRRTRPVRSLPPREPGDPRFFAHPRTGAGEPAHALSPAPAREPARPPLMPPKRREGGHSAGEGGWRANPARENLILQVWVPCSAKDVEEDYFELRRLAWDNEQFQVNLTLRKGRRPDQTLMTVNAVRVPVPESDDEAEYMGVVREQGMGDCTRSHLGFFAEAAESARRAWRLVHD